MRTKNRDKDAALCDLPELDQLIAVTQGRTALDAGQQWVFLANELRWALKCARKRRPRGLAKEFQNKGWQAVLSQAPDRSSDAWSKAFHKYAARPLIAIMAAATAAIDTGNAKNLRKIADALEGAGGATADPVAHEVLHLSRTGDTAADVQQRVAQWHGDKSDVKTVRRRMKALGKKPAPGRRGAPPGKRSPQHRAR